MKPGFEKQLRQIRSSTAELMSELVLRRQQLPAHDPRKAQVRAIANHVESALVKLDKAIIKASEQ